MIIVFMYHLCYYYESFVVSLTCTFNAFLSNKHKLLHQYSLLSMTNDKEIETFLSQYDEKVFNHALKLRQLLLKNLPNIIEQIDIPAKMISYTYGQKYAEMICAIIPSKKGLKLGFNRGVDLRDPDKLLEGTGKISRYVEIKSEEEINSLVLKKLIEAALAAYKERIKALKK
jgi:hypothetical protein